MTRGSAVTAAILYGHWPKKGKMKGIGSACQGFASDSCDSYTGTPDQSPLTPFPILPGFLPYLGFSALANSSLQQGQMYPMLFCGMPSPHTKLQLPPESLDEAPAFVNARQFHRILKRRIARRSQNWQARKSRNRAYLHESRHRHACNRMRGPSGIFLPKGKLGEKGESVEMNRELEEGSGRKA